MHMTCYGTGMVLRLTSLRKAGGRDEGPDESPCQSLLAAQDRLALIMNGSYRIKSHLSPVCVSVASHGSLISAKYTSTSKQTAASPSATHKPPCVLSGGCAHFYSDLGTLGLIVCIYVIICKCWVLLFLLSSSLDTFKEQTQN